MQAAAVLVRREHPSDTDTVRAIVAAAFARSEVLEQLPAEVDLLDELRADAGWVSALSLVAVDLPTTEVVGYVVCTRGHVNGHRALGLGPLAVRPDHQRHGIGTALMHAVLGAADAQDESVVALLGEPSFYRRFGFRSSTEYGIVAPEPSWGDYFQARPLAGHSPTIEGRFRYARSFEML